MQGVAREGKKTGEGMTGGIFSRQETFVVLLILKTVPKRKDTS